MAHSQLLAPDCDDGPSHPGPAAPEGISTPYLRLVGPLRCDEIVASIFRILKCGLAAYTVTWLATPPMGEAV